MGVHKLVDLLRTAFLKDLESHKKGHLCVEKLKAPFCATIVTHQVCITQHKLTIVITGLLFFTMVLKFYVIGCHRIPIAHFPH